MNSIHFVCTCTYFSIAEGSDYERLSTEVTLFPSNPERCMSVNVVDDSAVELDESLTVSLSLPAGELSSVQLTQHTATILITDNDGALFFSDFLTKLHVAVFEHVKISIVI